MSQGWITKVASLAAMLLMTGCGYKWTSDSIWASSIDLSEKVIITSERNDTVWPRVCVEPSPDAASALSLSLAGKYGFTGSQQAELAASLQRGESYIGLRTHSIQLLRDMAYRACEAYLSGALSNGHYSLLLRRYQRNMVALMSIEQLTGVVKTPPVVVSLESSANASNALLVLQKNINSVDSEISRINAEISKLDAKNEDDNKTINMLNSQIESYSSIKETLKESMKETQEQVASGKVNSSTGNISVPARNIDVDTSGIVQAVKEITFEILDDDDAPFLCFDYFQNEPAETNETMFLSEYCTKHLIKANKPIKGEDSNNTETSGASIKTILGSPPLRK